AGVTFGRYTISTGADQFVAQRMRTLGVGNSGPLVGPIVISEINYHPPELYLNGVPLENLMDQYVELQNISGSAVLLYDGSLPANTWHLRNAIQFEFPPGVSLLPSGFLLVVGFDPAADPDATADFRL